MRLKVDQLAAALKKSLLPVYVVTGDEPLQTGEAADEIRLAAKQAGYTTREVIAIDTGNEWPQLSTEADSLSIFADKKLIDLRLPSGKAGLDGSKTLIAYCQNLPAETILLISAAKFDSSAQKSQWFQALDAVGAIIQVWPLQGSDLLAWLQRRAAKKAMSFDDDAVKSLAARIEGNLLAAAQEIEKLYILHGASRISKAMIEDQVADSSRFDVFKLTDALLQGKLNRAVKILHGLKAEGIAAPVVLWAMSREARALINIGQALKQGGHQEAVYKKHQIFEQRKPLIHEALKRLKAAELQAILRLCATTDQQIKGQLAGDSWESLFNLCCLFTNTPMLSKL